MLSDLCVVHISQSNMHVIARQGTRWSTDKRHTNVTGSLESCLQQSAFMKDSTTASRCDRQFSWIDMEPPPSVSWRVTLLPTLFPLNSVKEELRGNWISEDEERVESNSIDSVLARTTERIRMDCRELSSGASHYEQHFSDTSGLNGRNIIFYGHSDFCVENYLHTRIVESRPLYLPRSALSAQLGSLTRTSQMSDDTNEDESCKSVFSSYYIQTEALGTALLETQAGSPCIEGGLTPRKSLTVSPITKISLHANKSWAPTQRPECSRAKGDISAINTRRLGERKEIKQTKRVEQQVIDSSLEGVSQRHSSRADAREVTPPPRQQVRGAPSLRGRTPRPLWAMLQNRTFKVIQEDPSIFSPGVLHAPARSRANIVSTSKQKGCWDVINRRIFGIREISRHNAGFPPERVIFGGGIRLYLQLSTIKIGWTLNLGHAR